MTEKGKVYIASMKMRGQWADVSDLGNHITVNATSMQAKTSEYRKDFSPMTAIDGRYKGFYCFENYWQGYKRFPNHVDLNTNKSLDSRDTYVQYWKNLEVPKRKNPFSDAKPVDAIYEDGITRDYYNARVNIYIPQYFDLVKNKPSIKKILDMLNKGINIVVFDFDGPKDVNGNCVYMEITLDNLKNKVKDLSHPFGHGYIIAALLSGFEPKDYIL